MMKLFFDEHETKKKGFRGPDRKTQKKKKKNLRVAGYTSENFLLYQLINP